jgi:4-hydroxybenzoyl-CoA thioesterase
MLTNRRAILVEWGDCDPSGVVFNPRYFAWFDASLHALLARGGLTYDGLVTRHGVNGMPLVEAHTKFLAPLRYLEQIAIETTVTKLHRCAFELHHRVLKDGELAAECFETRVLTAIDPVENRTRARPLPSDLIECLSAIRSS